MKSTWWESGLWNAICDRCGLKFKSNELRLEWDGLRVCDDCFETRHPQELTRPIPDQPALPWTRPDPAAGNPDLEDYTADGYCTATGRQGLFGYGQFGCAIYGLDLGYRDTPTFI